MEKYAYTYIDVTVYSTISFLCQIGMQGSQLCAKATSFLQIRHGNFQNGLFLKNRSNEIPIRWELPVDNRS
jgi:hypothetical protein